MKLKFFYISLCLFVSFYSCAKNNNSATQANTTPSNLKVEAAVVTDSSGKVNFTATANNVTSYDYDFGNGIYQNSTSGSIGYQYFTAGTYTVTVIAKNAAGQTVAQTIQVTIPAIKLKLVWADEFNTPGSPNPNYWNYDIGTGSNGWGNNELEYYTNRLDNAIVANGVLKIIAKKENYGGMAYTSARLLTKDKYSFKYGKIEVRAKLPANKGTWGAAWMLGSNFPSVGWPACGEIDIMEHVGNNLNTIYGTLHYPTQVNNSGDGATIQIPTATTDFHIYAAIWTPDKIQFLVDDVPFYTFTNKSNLPFNQTFFIILNLAMGGNFGGTIDPVFTSSTMEIDYVRVYQ